MPNLVDCYSDQQPSMVETWPLDIGFIRCSDFLFTLILCSSNMGHCTIPHQETAKPSCKCRTCCLTDVDGRRGGIIPMKPGTVSDQRVLDTRSIWGICGPRGSSDIHLAASVVYCRKRDAYLSDCVESLISASCAEVVDCSLSR